MSALSKYADGERRNRFTDAAGMEFEDAEKEVWRVVNGDEDARVFLNGEEMDTEKILRLLVRLQADEQQEAEDRIVQLGARLADALLALDASLERNKKLKRQLRRDRKGRKNS